MTASERNIILRAMKPHKYAPGAIAVHMAAFEALPIMQQARAINIYLMLLAEPTLPAKLCAKRDTPVQKKSVYRHNAETVKRAAMARRKLEEMNDDHDHD